MKTASESASRQQLKKHVGTIHTSAPLSLLQRKSFTVLVFHSYPELLTRRTHEISVDLFRDLIGFDSHDTRLLEDSLLQLVKTAINWEDGEGRERKWAATTFLASAQLKDGICRYEFSEFLAQELFKPEIYARINVGAIRDFETKHGLALYENCARYRPYQDFQGGTPEWPLDLFRKLMGVDESTHYSDFKRINERIIKPAVKEVNSCSDIAVEPKFKKRGRSVVSVAFGVRDNGHIKPAQEYHDASHPLTAEAFRRYKIPLLKGAEWLETYGEERFAEVLRTTNEMVVQGKAKSPVGFMRRALEENYMFALDAKTTRKNEREQKEKTKIALKTKEKQIKAETERLRLGEEQLTETAITRFEGLAADEQQEILDTLSAGNAFFRDRYAQQGRAGLLTGMLRNVLAHYLGEKWSLR